MQVKYIWIEEYKNLKGLGFNLNSGSNEKFEYDQGELRVTKEDIIIPTDFYSNNIKGITAVVGRNGSGKTNFSEFLNYNLAHARNGGLSTYILGKGIIVLENKIFVQENISLINKKELENEGYQVIFYENATLDKGQGELQWHKMEKNKYIYYNPNFEFRILDMASGRENIINISTSYLSQNDRYNTMRHELPDVYSYRKKQGTDMLLAHYRNDKLRESDLILNFPAIAKLISRTPHILTLTIDHPSENNLLNHNLYRDESHLTKSRKTIETFLNEKYSDLIRLSSFQQFKIKGDEYESEFNLPIEFKKEQFKRFFLLNFLRVYLYLNPDIILSKEFLLSFIYDAEKKYSDEVEPDLLKIKILLIEFLRLCKSDNTNNKVQHGYYLDSDKREINVLDLFRNEILDTRKDHAVETFVKLVDKTKKILKGELHFHYQFNHKLSSGEQNLLNFYSRFYWAKEQVVRLESDEYGIEGERIVIFIDEGEIALHPEWQRRYFKLVVDFLSELFDDREIQLIITTHSPFVLSDIPKEHIIFLKPNEETGNAEIANFNRDETFGANIYTLLSDSFFMEEGTIGEFAKGKIEKTLSLLSQTGELSVNDINFIDTIINAVGEPLIKMQLEKLRTEKLEESIIQRMQKRIDELEANQNKRSDDQD